MRGPNELKGFPRAHPREVYRPYMTHKTMPVATNDTLSQLILPENQFLEDRLTAIYLAGERATQQNTTTAALKN